MTLNEKIGGAIVVICVLFMCYLGCSNKTVIKDSNVTIIQEVSDTIGVECDTTVCDSTYTELTDTTWNTIQIDGENLIEERDGVVYVNRQVILSDTVVDKFIK